MSETPKAPLGAASGYATERYVKRINDYGDFEIYRGEQLVASTYAGAVAELNRQAEEIRQLRYLVWEVREWGIASKAWDAIRAHACGQAADELLRESHNDEADRRVGDNQSTQKGDA